VDMRRLATLAQLAILLGLLMTYLVAVATQDWSGAPADLPGWRDATPLESLHHDLEQRRALEQATRP
jgi:hypothetical protein